MKLRYRLISCFAFCWLAPLIAHANSMAELIEQFPLGEINWTRGVITAKAAVTPQTDLEIGLGGQISHPAFEQAVQNVVSTLMQLRVDDNRCVSHLFTANKSSRAKVESMARLSKVVSMGKTPIGEEEISIQMSLYGGFAQFMLPTEIQQVQPIKPLNRAYYHRNSQNVGMDLSNGYTGLIVDARGTGAKPSMVPTVLDEQGYEVFGPAYVSREFAVQYGICQYIGMVNDGRGTLSRVAPKPLLVKGLRTANPNSCNIVISNADASKLRGTSEHLNFLKQCRVMIVLD
jgi:hypothetical protein